MHSLQFLSTYPSILPLAMVVMAGACVAWVGWRGRGVGEHPECRRCGFDLFGRPAGSTMCPECGADLATSGAVLAAGAVRRPGLLVVGLLLAAGGLTRLATGVAREVSRDPDHWKPSAWLAREAFGEDAARRADAIDELKGRLQNGKLSDGSIATLTEAALARQADNGRPWDTAWGDWVETARLDSKLTDEQWNAYLRRAAEQVVASARVRVRPRVRRGDPFPLVVEHSPARVGTRTFGAQWHVRLAFDDGQSGEPLSLPLFAIGAASAPAVGVVLPENGVGADNHAPPVPGHPVKVAPLPAPYSALKDGRHTLVVRGVVRVFRTAATSGAPEVEVPLRAEAPWELSPRSARPVDAEEDPDRREAMEKALRLAQLCSVGAGAWVSFDGLAWPGPLPTGLAHDVFLRADGREWFAGSITAAPGATVAMPHGRREVIRGLRGPCVDVILRPNGEQAVGTVDVVRVWADEWVLRGVPLPASIRPISRDHNDGDSGAPHRRGGQRSRHPAFPSAAQTSAMASSSARPPGVAALGLLAWYQRRVSRGERTVRLPGIWRYAFGSVWRTQSQA